MRKVNEEAAISPDIVGPAVVAAATAFIIAICTSVIVAGGRGLAVEAEATGGAVVRRYGREVSCW